MRPPSRSTTAFILVKPIHYISSDEGSKPHWSIRGLSVLPWVQGLLVSGYCPYTLWYILRTSTCPMNLGISQNKTVNSFVGRLQGIRTLKISEAMTSLPQWTFLARTSCKFYDGKVQTSACTILGFRIWCTAGFEPLVTEG